MGDVDIVRINRTTISDDGHIIIYCRTINGEKIEINFHPDAAETLRIALERLKRPFLRSAELIVKTAKRILKEFLVRKEIEFEENVKIFDLNINILQKKGSALRSPEAYVFIPNILVEETIMKYDVVFNDESKNTDGINCIIVAAGATEEAIRKARKRVQVYDVHDERKGDGYDSPLLEVIMDSFFQIKFSRIS